MTPISLGAGSGKLILAFLIVCTFLILAALVNSWLRKMELIRRATRERALRRGEYEGTK